MIFAGSVSCIRLPTLYTVDATKFVTAQFDATFHEGRGELLTVS